MKLKIYFVSALVLASTLIGFTPSTKAQDTNTRAIACNNCSESSKQQLVHSMVDYGHTSGQYRFVVIDMEGGNVHEYDVNVPVQQFGEFGQSSQQPTVTLVYKADQAFRNQRVREARDAVKEVEDAVDEFVGNFIPMPADSGYVSAYSALKNQAHFGADISLLLANTSSLASKVRHAHYVAQLMAEIVQMSIGAGTTFSTTISRSISVWVTFADGSKIKVILKLDKTVGENIGIMATTTLQAVDKNGKAIPKNGDTLPYYNFGGSEINQSAFQSYFNSIGIAILYGNWTSNDSNCATKWKCSSNGKSCELIVITNSC